MAGWINIDTKLPKPCKFYFVVVRTKVPSQVLCEKEYFDAEAKILWYNRFDKKGNSAKNPWNLSNGEEITHWKPLCKIPCVNANGKWKIK